MASLVPAVAAGAGVITNIVGNAQNRKIAREQMDFQEDMVRHQMRFQREMSNTAYRRAVADMKAAGINPILAYSQGGASSPQGSSAIGARRDYRAPISEAIQNALAARQAVASIKQTKEQTRLIAAQAKLQELREPKAAIKAEPWKLGEKALEKSGLSSKDIVDTFPRLFLRENPSSTGAAEAYKNYKNFSKYSY